MVYLEWHGPLLSLCSNLPFLPTLAHFSSLPSFLSADCGLDLAKDSRGFAPLFSPPPTATTLYYLQPKAAGRKIERDTAVTRMTHWKKTSSNIKLPSIY